MSDDFIKIQKYKKFFKSELAKGRILQWDELYQIIIQDQEIQPELSEKLHQWHKSIIQLELLRDLPPQTEEIFIHNLDTCYIKTHDATFPFFHDYSPQDMETMLNFMAIHFEQSWNLLNPFVSFNIQAHRSSFRVTLIHPSLNPEGQSKAFIRVLNKEPIPLENFNFSKQLHKIVNFRKNILIAGSTGSGKTTLLNGLLSQVNENEHVVILEDTFELRSPNIRTTRLLAGSSSLDELLSYSLRMSPERIVLGEIRSKEVLTYILGMNTGHKGMMTSIHANNAKDALQRLALLYLTYTNSQMSYELILKLICNNIDYVIFMENKQILEVIEVFGSENMNIFYDQAV